MPLSPGTLLDADARRKLAGLPGLGGGNVWHTAARLSPWPDLPAVVADRPLVNADGELQSEFSLRQLDELSRVWSAWYLDQGVRPRDRVAVYLSDSFEDQLHLAALAQIGAIALVINGRMEADTALRLMARTGPVGLYTDETHRGALAGRERTAGVRWTRTRADAAVLGHCTLPDAARFHHAPDDPVMLCHSSGTTGDPKPVIHAHWQSVAGVCHRLTGHAEPPTSVLLSAAPHSHAGATAFTFYALLAGLPLIAVDDPSGPGVARAVRTHRPTTVLAFNQTHSALATMELDPADFASVAYWINMGDAAHDAHIRRLIRLGHHRVDGELVAGSGFGDGLGSSELGWAALRRTITAQTPPSPRLLGRPEECAEVVVLREDGAAAAPGEVGMLGVRSETVAPGYWNDHDTNYRSRLAGYWLSGDLAYRTADGDFYHADRIVDAIHTPGGTGYSVLMEETLLLQLPEVADCAVVAGGAGGVTLPVALVRLRGEADPGDLLRRANKALADIGQPPLALLETARDASDIPVGSTGKVLKRLLRERYGDLRGHIETHPTGVAAELPVPHS
ncbi:class I adenylate-forming enzyme family protein [Streptomyces sp. NPDC059398]|uniref:class I adenylate-forming enzyme family protein n=1 Tax=Streptomyces sp. NPDC059398 TaxID=3346820 RepID=UPI003677930C